MPAAGLRIGYAGWSLSSKVADQFPAEGSHLERYAARFNGVEIDSSFYRSHKPETYARWGRSVPADFRFSVKLPRTITHDARLQEVDALLDGFMSEVRELGARLGCLLVQLPPSLAFDEEQVYAFFAAMRARADGGIACEPRHLSWFTEDADAVMAAHRIAFVHADPLPVAAPPRNGDTRVAYRRLHGSPDLYRSAYAADQLAGLAAELNHPVKTQEESWVIFDNTALGHAVPDALQLQRLTGDPA